MALNTDKVLLKILKFSKKDGSIDAEGLNIQGLFMASDNWNNRVFTYLPPTLPIDYGEEVEAYQAAILDHR